MYFVVPMKGGGTRPILDLRALNKHLRRYRFRMLTHLALLRLVHPGDWFNLINKYFHMPIYPPHRKFLRIAFQGVICKYLVLLFSLSLSLRANGIRLANGCKVKAGSCCTHRIPNDAPVFTGVSGQLNEKCTKPHSVDNFHRAISRLTLRACLSPDRTETFHACFVGGIYVTLKLCHRLLGMIVSVLVTGYCHWSLFP